jgi:eukaryotic-like serine/threonine-protein kinase
VLDAYSAAWTSMRVDACEAAKVRREQPPEVYQLRSECLDREMMEMRALTSVLRRADKDVVASSVKAAYGLTAVSWCADVAGLRGAPGLPADPGKRAKVTQARVGMATALSLGLAGKTAEAKAAVMSALQIARDAGDRSTEAEALYALGMNEQRLGEYDGSADTLGDAMAAAYASGNDVTLVQSASLLAFVAGDKLYRPDDARRILLLAHAGLERIGGSDDVEADVLSTEGLLLVTQGYPDRAVPLLERVITDYRRTLGVHPVTAIHLNNLGYADHLRGRNREALAPLTESRSIFESLFGSENNSSAIAICNLGAAHLGMGDVGEARTLLAHALQVFDGQSPDGYWSAWTLQYLVLAAGFDGDAASSLAFGRRALAISGKLQSARRLVPGTSVASADALLASGAPEQASEALALCDRALEVQDKVGLIAPDKVYDWDALRCRGEALLALGRPREALAPLERSVTLPLRVWPWDLGRAKLALARALLETKGDAARANALAEDARSGLAAMPYTKKLVGLSLRQAP